MKASTYYKVTGASAVIAILSAVFFNQPGIPPALPGTIAVLAALAALAAYFVNYKEAHSDNLDIIDEDFPVPHAPQLVQHRTKHVDHNRNAGGEHLFPLLAWTLANETTRGRSLYSISQPFKDRHVRIFLDRTLEQHWRFHILNKEVAHLLSEAVQPSRDLDVALYRLLGEPAEPKATTLLKQAERLERQIEKLAQQRLERVIRQAEDVLTNEQEPEIPNAIPPSDLKKSIIH